MRILGTRIPAIPQPVKGENSSEVFELKGIFPNTNLINPSVHLLGLTALWRVARLLFVLDDIAQLPIRCGLTRTASFLYLFQVRLLLIVVNWLINY